MFLLRCIGWNRKRREGYHMIYVSGALVKTGCENIETTVRKQMMFFCGDRASWGYDRPRERVVGEVEGTTCHSRRNNRAGQVLSNRIYRLQFFPSTERWRSINPASVSDMLSERHTGARCACSIRRITNSQAHGARVSSCAATSDIVELKVRVREGQDPR